MGQQLGSISESYLIAPASALYTKIFSDAVPLVAPLGFPADRPHNLDSPRLPRFPELRRRLPRKTKFTRSTDWIWKSHAYIERLVPRTRLWRNLVVDTVYPKPPRHKETNLVVRHEPYPDWLQKQFDAPQSFVTINGRSTKKRRAEDTEVDLVAALQKHKDTKHTDLDATFAQQETTRSSLSNNHSTGGASKMVPNILSAVTELGDKIRRLLFNQTYSVSESRYLVEVHGSKTKSTSVHVANKRIKFRCDDFELQWLDQQELAELITDFGHFRRTLGRVCESIHSYPLRSEMNRLLSPLTSALVDNLHDMRQLNSGQEDFDLVNLFNLMCHEIFALLDKIYEVGAFFNTKALHRNGRIPMTGPYSLTPAQVLTTTRIKNLLSAPCLFTVLQGVLDISGRYTAHPLPIAFIDRIVLDMKAMSNNIILPSYIKSDVFHTRVRMLFPASQRTDNASQERLPGTFPESEIPQSEPSSLPEPAASPKPPVKTMGFSLKDGPVYISRGKVAARYRMRNPCSQQERRTRDEFDHRYYQKGGIRDAIKNSYITEFVARIPPNKSAIGALTSILTNRKTHPSRCAPKRLAIRRPPKTVRFTEDTLSPRQRSHIGCEIPRIKDVGEHSEVSSDAKALEAQPDPIFNGSARRLFAEPRHSMKANAAAAIEQILSLPSIEGLRISDDTRAGIALRKEEAAQKAAEQAQKVAEERARRERDERLARTGGLRAPKHPLVSPVSLEWTARAEATLRASSSTALATTAEGVDLRRHDFGKVVPATEWLNDEIINGSLNWLDRSINSAAGIDDVKRHTRKCLSMSSFFFKRLQEQGVARTQRTLRRYGVEKRNLLDIDTILLPICESYHWTLLAIRPGKRTIAHMNSLSPRGTQQYLDLGLAWLKDVLEERFIQNEWKIVHHEAPRQVNGYDCGVHTVTNGICVALGLNPIDSYTSDDMPRQRIRLACMLLNGGFKGDFALEIY